MDTDWVYLTLGEDGFLRDDDGYVFAKRSFSSLAEAEKWIEAEDIRATIR